jgi:hypothetical protein
MNSYLQLELFASAEKEDAIRDHMKIMRCCWPEWDGPKVGYYCSVGECCATHEDGTEAYHYMERVKLLSQRDDGLWLGVIEHSERTIARAPWVAESNGTRLLLDILDIWPPTDDLWDSRKAAL